MRCCGARFNGFTVLLVVVLLLLLVARNVDGVIVVGVAVSGLLCMLALVWARMWPCLSLFFARFVF